jgi:hypothetical protein
MECLLTIIILIIVGSLSKSAIITPFMAGGLGIAIGNQFHLNNKYTLIIVIGLYLMSYISNSFSNQSNSVDITLPIERELNPNIIWITRIITIAIFVVIPIGKPIFYIPAVLAVLLGILFTQPSYKELSYFFITFITYIGVILVVERINPTVNFSLPIIASISVPRLLSPHLDNFNYNDIECSDKTKLNPFKLSFAALITWITPGLSSSLVTNSMFENKHKEVVGTLLESSIEGWTISLLLNYTLISSKSPLGDLFNILKVDAIEIELSFLTILTLLALISFFSIISPKIFPENKTVSAVVLIAQSTIQSGFQISLIFLVLGYLFYLGKSMKPMLLMSQML